LRTVLKQSKAIQRVKSKEAIHHGDIRKFLGKSNKGIISILGNGSNLISGLDQLVGKVELGLGGCINSGGRDLKHCNLHLGQLQQTTVHATEEETTRA
jgi:hypothetical protein